uniref:Uncharacterized protein n=1 Tax=Solanum lycopersicum TaxID=4081 RepID=A0A3Q7EEX2_SOLLC
MLETTLLALEDLMLDKIVDEAGRKVLLSEFSKIMQQELYSRAKAQQEEILYLREQIALARNHSS